MLLGTKGGKKQLVVHPVAPHRSSTSPIRSSAVESLTRVATSWNRLGWPGCRDRGTGKSAGQHALTRGFSVGIQVFTGLRRPNLQAAAVSSGYEVRDG